MGVSGEVYLAVHVPEFPAQALLRLRPELRGRVVAVLEGTAPLEQVCSASLEALRVGVRRGMSKAELEGFAGVEVLRRSAAEEGSAQSALLQAAGVLTPRMEVVAGSPTAIDVVLDMTGTARLHGAVEKVVVQLVRALGRMQFAVQAAVSANFRTAMCLAAVTTKGPVFVALGDEARAIRGLPLSALRLTETQAETLEMWGLRTVGELAELPERELVVRLGQEGRRLRLLARGEHPHLMVPEEPELRFREVVSFDAPVESLDSLLFMLGPMLDQLLLRAQGHALALAVVTVELGLDGGGRHERRVKPALPVSRREVLLRLLHLDLQAHPPGAGVMSVVVVAEVAPPSRVQAGLFAPDSPEPLRLEVTLARIAAVVGEGRVGRPRLLDTLGPAGFAVEPFTVSEERPPVKPDEVPGTARCVARRCRPAVRLSMRLERSRPVGFRLRGGRYTVERALGPWRSSGGWWAGGVWSREEWDVCAVSEAGEVLLCVVSRDLLRQRWQMEAVYD